jgi:hypothetical protein
MYLFFIWRLDLMILMGANSLLGPLNGMDTPMALVMDFPASKSLRTAPYKQQGEYINSYSGVN